MTFGSRLGNAQASLALRSACRRFLIVGIKRGILFFTEVIGRVYHVKPIVGLPCFFQCYIDFVFLLLARESSSKLSFTEVALPRDSSSKLGSPLGLRNVGSPLARASVDFVFLLLARESSSKLGSPLARASVHLTDKIFLALCILAFTHVNFVFLLLAQQCSSELGIVFARASVRSYTCAASQQLLRHNSLILLLLQNRRSSEHRAKLA